MSSWEYIWIGALGGILIFIFIIIVGSWVYSSINDNLEEKIRKIAIKCIKEDKERKEKRGNK